MSNKKVSRTRRKYDVAFKDEVIKMVAAGRAVSEVSQGLGFSASLVHPWYKSSLYNAPGTPKSSVSVSPSHHSTIDEIERLKGELRRTE